ncbi:7-deoxyloganetin glucosyltransferase [Dorcoceras hygrometricum]|uniref:7-deoxyloganetin glucosyltransferase n=1 Tax=Dorcoceras hygrometricum TaxID=472368 RepID=A0A2Z7D021_9LAMI|nr:7-deoxyloganetin glucosyltransferase [Dorcoceras hygrometricum]
MCARLIPRRAQEPARWPRLVARRRATLGATSRKVVEREQQQWLDVGRLSLVGWTSGACRAMAGRRALVAHLGWTSGASSARGGLSMIAAPRDGGRPAVARWCCWMCRSRAKIAGRRGATLRAAVRRAWRNVARLPLANFVVAAAGRAPLRRSSGDVVTADFF